MLKSANKGYAYQDILAAYFIAQEIADGNDDSKFLFDQKKTSGTVKDKFDDLVIYQSDKIRYFQIKYSDTQRRLTKDDFSSSSRCDMAIFDLFVTWQEFHNDGDDWRVLLGWDIPESNDSILYVLDICSSQESLLPNTTCYKFNFNSLWPEGVGVLSSWRALKQRSSSIDREKFGEFLNCLVIEVNCPKSSLLYDLSSGLEKHLVKKAEKIGIGDFPNDHMSKRQFTESLCVLSLRYRSTNVSSPITCEDIIKELNINTDFGGIEQNFPVDKSILVETPNRIEQVTDALKKSRKVIVTAEPGSGKSWFIENLENHIQDSTQVIKHYCYVDLNDPLVTERITVNVMMGSLIKQILESDEDLRSHKTRRYSSNLDQLNILLGEIKKKTLVIVDGLDHIWRVYQKNRGGLAEDATTILKSLSLVDVSNPNVSLLIVSQPIEHLANLVDFSVCELQLLSERFIVQLLKKYDITNREIDGQFLSSEISEKSAGNALYIKYLIDHAEVNLHYPSFDWIDELPSYEFNLTTYYKYLYDQIEHQVGVPYALCGADFSLNTEELNEITKLGDLVNRQIALLKPILRYKKSYGYSIYHESFKRFVIDSIKNLGGSVQHLIYIPVITWLESHSFFESLKSFGNLLKLYFEIGAYDKIAGFITEDFLEKSLYFAQPITRIRQNHKIQRASLRHLNDFSLMLIVSEQAKVIYDLDHLPEEVLIKYLEAVQLVHGDEFMYRVLWDGENLLITDKSCIKFLKSQAYKDQDNVHWSIFPKLDTIPYDVIGDLCIKYLCLGEYKKFDELVKELNDNSKHQKAIELIIEEIEKWSFFNSSDWMYHTPFYSSLYDTELITNESLSSIIQNIILEENFQFKEDWKTVIRRVQFLSETASEVEKNKAISLLSGYNWFRNWLIYVIKINSLKSIEYSNDDVIDAFSYLVRDLEPFRGSPRACDLYSQLTVIRSSFHLGLSLCNSDTKLLKECFSLLEKVTELTTSIQRSYSGPLKPEEFLELMEFYLTSEYVVGKYEEYYQSLGSRRLYVDLAETAFNFSKVLSLNDSDKALQLYRDGVQAMTAYGFRKDRTLSEILYSSVPFQERYGSLDPEWFFEIYHMAMTVVSHTDGKSTSRYPIEWFKEFIKVYPDEAIRFLVSETIESDGSNWHQETEMDHVLENYPKLFTPTQWYLLCRSMPLISSNQIIEYGLSIINDIDTSLQKSFLEWLKTLPFKMHSKEEYTFPESIVEVFQKLFNIKLKPNIKEEKQSRRYREVEEVIGFPTQNLKDVQAYLELHPLQESDVNEFQDFITSLENHSAKKEVLQQAVTGFRYGKDLPSWARDLFEEGSDEWIYYNVYLSVFLMDGWFHGMHFTEFIKRAHAINPEISIQVLKEAHGKFLSKSDYDTTYLVSCNLVKALAELGVQESEAKELLDLTFRQVKRRLPHQVSSEINPDLYNGLEEFSRDEMVVAILIARLKALSTEKNQNIIWTLTYIARTNPRSLIKPYCWQFSNHTFLLPIQRAFLLQILRAYVDPAVISDSLIANLIKIYPSGYFLEDQLIRSFVNYKLELEDLVTNALIHGKSKHDLDFFPYMHIKYRSLVDQFGPLDGTFNAYSYRRDEINKKYESYFNRSDNVMTPIVSLANAAYEIVNTQYYNSLKEILWFHHPGITFNLKFFLNEIILYQGSLTKRPTFLKTVDQFPASNIEETSSADIYEGWVLIASNERVLQGELFKSKNEKKSSIVLTFGNNPKEKSDLYAQYIFNLSSFKEENIIDAPIDSPICYLTLADTLESMDVIFVAPWIVRELNLKLDKSIHNGLSAVNEDGEGIIRLLVWKEKYYGSISDGTEVPSIKGEAVLIREDYFNKLMALSENNVAYFVYRKES